MRLADLLDMEELVSEMEAGYIGRQLHPIFPYAILNYTAAAMFDYRWNDTTKKCRGLIYHTDTTEIIARPFDKFFNYGEYGDGWIEQYKNSPCVVTDKLDGSLGILYPYPDGRLAVATRGSFTSDQAVHATKLLRTKYESWAGGVFGSEAGDYTHLVEIIYPDNRIIVNYGDMDDLVYLGARNIEYGYTLPPTSNMFNCPFPQAEVMPYTTFKEAFEAQHRKGQEGMVVHFLERDVRVKIKQPDYVEIARIVFGLNEKTVFKAIWNPGKKAPGPGIEYIKHNCPEEFWPWIDEIHNKFLVLYSKLYVEARAAYETLMQDLTQFYDDDWTRKDFAQRANTYGNLKLIMLFFDQKYDLIDRAIWAMVWQSVDGSNHLKVADMEDM